MSTLLACLLLCVTPKGEVTVDYRVQVSAERTDRWRVELDVRGLDPDDADLLIELTDWGEWTEVDTLYLSAVEGEPPLVPVEGKPHAFAVDAPRGWKGSLRASYELRLTRVGSRVRERKGLLPWYGADYTMGYTQNTLMRPVSGGEDVLCARTLELVAPKDWVAYSGIAGLQRRPEPFEVPARERNSLIALGALKELERHGAGAGAVEVVHFGAREECARKVLEVVRDLVPAMAGTTRHPLGRPVRLFVHDAGDGGGTATDYGISIPVRRDQLDNAYARHTICHETYHAWLGGELRADGRSLAWFWEGFTDYLSLWHACAVGVIPREFFAVRMLELEREVRGCSARDTAAFADPSVNWRAGDNEVVAYKGGAVFALAIDAELRAAGNGTLSDLMADLLDLGRPYALADIGKWLRERDLGDLWERCAVGVERPDATRALALVGFAMQEAEDSVTYLGMRAKEGTLSECAELDPDGPLARAGMQVGDVISLYHPARSDPPELKPGLETAFDFGLTMFAPEADEWYVVVKRGEEEVRLAFTPELRPWAQRRRPVPRGKDVDRFFRIPRSR